MESSSQEKTWYLARDGQRYGPISEDELQKLIASNHVKPEDLVWRQGFTEWVEAGSIPGFLDPEPVSVPETNTEPPLETIPDPEQFQKPKKKEEKIEPKPEPVFDTELKAEPVFERPEFKERPEFRERAEFKASEDFIPISDKTPDNAQKKPVKNKKSLLRRVASFLIIMSVLLGICLVALPAIIPADFIREQIARQVKEKTGRTLTVRGNSKFSLIPNIGVKMHQVSLSNPPGVVGPPLIKMSSLDIQLKFWPLLERKIEIKRFILEEPEIALRLDGQGRNNWSFAEKYQIFKNSRSAEAQNIKAPSQGSGFISFFEKLMYGPVFSQGQYVTNLNDLKLGEVKVINGSVSYNDEKSNFAERIGNLNVNISLSNLASWLTAVGTTNWKSREISFDINLQSPMRLLTGEKLPINLNVKSTHFRHFLDGELSWADGPYITGETELQIPSLRAVSDWLKLNIAPVGGLQEFAIRGKLEAQSHKISFTEATVELDSTNATGEATIFLGRKVPYLKAKLNADKIDLNTYLKEASLKESQLRNFDFKFSEQASSDNFVKNVNQQGNKAEASFFTGGINENGQGQISARPINSIASNFEHFDADVNLSSENIIYEKMKIGNTVLDMKIRKGVMTAVIPNISLYTGTAIAKLVLTAKGAVPEFNSQVTISNVEALPFLRDSNNFDWISGKTNIKLDINGKGHSKEQILSSLNGKGSIAFVDGAIEGVNIAKLIRNLQKGEFQNWSRKPSEKTDFSELNGTFTIEKGIADNKDLIFVAPLIRAKGEGSIDLTKQWIDYRLQPKLVGNIEGQGTRRKNAKGLPIPIRLQGPLESPKVSLDLGEIAKNPESILQGINDVVNNIKKQKKKKKKIDFESLIQGVLGSDGESSSNEEPQLQLKF